MNLETTWPQNAGDRIAELEARVEKLENHLLIMNEVSNIQSYYGIKKTYANIVCHMADGNVYSADDLAKALKLKRQTIAVYMSQLRSAGLEITKHFTAYALSAETVAEVKKVLKREL